MDTGHKMPTQRQLRVGEEIRHQLSEVFMRGECHVPDIASASITVSEVRISPDLKNATAYVMPLGGRNADKLIDKLNDASAQIRRLVGNKMALRYSPRLHFRLDRSFEEAGRINSLLKSEKVQKDISAASDTSE